ncbi:MAG: triose-phosphate isomerase [Methanophagales archaeon ANME-1-THS]|nr:MAG: triose-phosphate isomerase [Methanophagales archaeon ANME-1-THS]
MISGSGRGIKTPVIVLNEKAYVESVGKKGVGLAQICEEVAAQHNVSIAICPQQVELAKIASQVQIPCFAQHVDPVEPGSQTGFVTLESVKEAGAVGSLVNHSEHRLKIADIDFIVSRAASLNLLTIVCTNNIAVSKAIAELKPYAIAVEPPELIGTGRAVSKVDPAIVEDTVKEVKRIAKHCVVLCGAGVTNGEDVRAAIELGADGVLLASGVVKAKDQRAALVDLVSGLE